MIIATSDSSQVIPGTVTIDQLAHAAHQHGYIQIPTTSADGETTIQQVQIQEADLPHGEAIQTVQIEVSVRPIMTYRYKQPRMMVRLQYSKCRSRRLIYLIARLSRLCRLR